MVLDPRGGRMKTASINRTIKRLNIFPKKGLLPWPWVVFPLLLPKPHLCQAKMLLERVSVSGCHSREGPRPALWGCGERSNSRERSCRHCCRNPLVWSPPRKGTWGGQGFADCSIYGLAWDLFVALLQLHQILGPEPGWSKSGVLDGHYGVLMGHLERRQTTFEWVPSHPQL